MLDVKPTPSPAVSSRSGASILFVDDQEMILRLMSRFFASRDYRVETAETRETAEERLAESSFDLIVSDLGLSRGGYEEGFELVDRARELQPGIRTVVLTGVCGEELEKEAAVRGVDAFLTKPQPLAALEERVRRLLESVEPNGNRLEEEVS